MLLSQAYPFTKLGLYVILVQNLPVNLFGHSWSGLPFPIYQQDRYQFEALKGVVDTTDKALSAAQVHCLYTVGVTSVVTCSCGFHRTDQVGACMRRCDAMLRWLVPPRWRLPAL